MSSSNWSRGLVSFIGIGFVAVSFFAANGIKKYRENLIELSYKVNYQKIIDSINIMSYNTEFLYSPMYTEKNPKNFDETSGKFLKQYMEVKSFCGNSNGKCFASNYRDLNKKKYEPQYRGACAILKNGASICLLPQIGNNDIVVLIDVNGKTAPNIFGKDLRQIIIKAKNVSVTELEEESEVIE